MTEKETATAIFEKMYEEWSSGTARNQSGYMYEKSFLR